MTAYPSRKAILSPGILLALLVAGCATDTMRPVSVYDLPPGDAVLLAACESREGARLAVAHFQESTKTMPDTPLCVKWPRPERFDVAACVEINGVYRDGDGDPFVACRVNEAGVTGLVWFFMPQPNGKGV